MTPKYLCIYKCSQILLWPLLDFPFVDLVCSDEHDLHDNKYEYNQAHTRAVSSDDCGESISVRLLDGNTRLTIADVTGKTISKLRVRISHSSL